MLPAQLASMQAFQPSHKPAKHVRSESALQPQVPNRPYQIHPLNGPPEPVSPRHLPSASASTTPLILHRISRDALAAMPALPEPPPGQDPADLPAPSRSRSRRSRAHRESNDTITPLPAIPIWQYHDGGRHSPRPTTPDHQIPLWRPTQHIEAERKAHTSQSTLQVPAWRPNPSTADSTPLWRPRQHETHPDLHTSRSSTAPFANPTPTPHHGRRPSLKVPLVRQKSGKKVRLTSSHGSLRATRPAPRPSIRQDCLASPSTDLHALERTSQTSTSPIQMLKQASLSALKKSAGAAAGAAAGATAASGAVAGNTSSMHKNKITTGNKVDKLARTKTRGRSERVKEARRGIRGVEGMGGTGSR